ncbi:MAG: ThuA domain-containing protein [Balneolaceae bacterium]|nr:ThuA domain-containing protein [Balneolaceae bacterium]
MPKILSLLTLCLMVGTSSMAQSFDVLVFSKTEGFRHNSIEVGVSAIQTLGEQHDFGVDATENASVFTTENLQNYDVVMFLNTSGDVLDGAQQDAFEGFIQQGGGFVGVHAASDTEREWPWFGQLVGAYFDNHPRVQQATVLVEDTTTSRPSICLCNGNGPMNGIIIRRTPVARFMCWLVWTNRVTEGETWGRIIPLRGCMSSMAAGRGIPVVDIPRSRMRSLRFWRIYWAGSGMRRGWMVAHPNLLIIC